MCGGASLGVTYPYADGHAPLSGTAFCAYACTYTYTYTYVSYPRARMHIHIIRTALGRPGAARGPSGASGAGDLS
ncbi:hypothetical protein BDZ91DRAFT_715183 [Kalaharituber pfeilii]|nr:hypothetical protein BDZ91DRAFT_715183 [Kalaharituber pfeilii]